MATIEDTAIAATRDQFDTAAAALVEVRDRLDNYTVDQLEYAKTVAYGFAGVLDNLRRRW